MSHMKGINPKYGVFNYTCSDHSCARSLYKQQKVISVKEMKRNTVSTSETVFFRYNMDWGTPNRQKLGIALFVCPLILYVV